MPGGGEAVGVLERGLEVASLEIIPVEGVVVGSCSCRMEVQTFFCGGDLHCRDAAASVIANDRLTIAVDGVAGVAAEGVVVARQVEVVLPLVGAVAVDVIGVEISHNTRRRRFGHVADAVVRHRDCRGGIRVGR